MPNDYKKPLRYYADEDLIVLEFKSKEDREKLIKARFTRGRLADIPMDWPDSKSMAIPKWAESAHTDLCRELSITVQTSSLGNFEELTADEIAEMRAERWAKKL